MQAVAPYLIGRHDVALKSFVGGTIFGSIVGSRPPTVLALHGWGRTHSDFDRVLTGFDAISVDLPGFGATPPPSAVWGARDYAAALIPILQEFEEPPVVVGHSFGGRVAVCVAASHPELVSALLIIGAPLVRPPDRPGARSPLRYRAVRFLRGLRLIPESRLEEARQRFGSIDYRSANGVMRDILVRVVNETYEQELSQLSTRTHLLWGLDDEAAPVAGARLAKDLLDQAPAEASMALLTGIGHDVLAEDPDKVQAELSMLLDR